MPQGLSEIQYGEFSERTYTRSYLSGVPTHGHFELTFRCPLKCTFCYCACYTTPEHTHRELATNEVLAILDEAAASGCLWMTFSGGDPFIRPDFRAIYDHAVGLGMIVSIFASGLILTDEWLEHLQGFRPFKIELPLYGVTQETYEKVAGKPNSFHRAMANIRRLLEAELPVKLKSAMLATNVHEIAALRAFVEGELQLKFNPNYFIFAKLDGSTDHLKDRLPPREIARLIDLYGESACDSATTSKDEDVGDGPNGQLFKCAAGINSFYINPYGELNFCTYVRVKSYDLRQGSLIEGVRVLREDLLARTRAEGSACTSCKVHASCKNCPGSAVVETGSMYG